MHTIISQAKLYVKYTHRSEKEFMLLFKRCAATVRLSMGFRAWPSNPPRISMSRSLIDSYVHIT